MGGNWLEIGTLAAQAGVDGDKFGHALDLDGTTALVGAASEGFAISGKGGKVYVYEVAVLSLGEACVCDAECVSGQCIDGVCCDDGDACTDNDRCEAGTCTSGDDVCTGTVDQPAAPESGSEAGCGCRVASARGAPGGVAALLAMLAFCIAARRRRGALLGLAAVLSSIVGKLT